MRRAIMKNSDARSFIAAITLALALTLNCLPAFADEQLMPDDEATATAEAG